ncbi:MAG TPA: outer membrane lipoprotein-sorting protein [Chthoniobacterales bacterium]|nr:outer membrane lipoprotein-sorting protein [Chthoniobacterales bacterium]
MRQAKKISRSAFGVHRSPFTVHRLTFGARRSAFGVGRLAFSAWGSVLGVFWIFFAWPACGQEDPNAILEQIRSAQAEISRPLSGRLRPENGDAIPFQLQLKGSEFVYSFTNPPETIRLLLTDTGSVMTDDKSGRQQTVAGSKFTQSVRGTDITYEDLSLRFLYWKNARYEGEQSVRTITCSVILVQPASRNSAYGSVRLWIAKNRGALIKAEGYDWQGKLIKRFEIISAQQIEGKTIFKQLRIERLDPQTGKVVSRTYLELEPT